MNLAQYLNRIYRDLGESNKKWFPQDLLIDWIYEAEEIINENYPCIFSEVEEDAVNGQRLYTLPSDILNFNIIGAMFTDNGRTDERYHLEPVDENQLSFNCGRWKNDTGCPDYVYVDEVNNSYGLYPYPVSLDSGNLTDAILLKYMGKPTKMTRFYETGTISVTNGSAVVTGSGTAFTGNVQAGDEIGIGSMLSRSVNFPTVWYTVLSVDSDTQLTLSANYAEATASGQSFIACSVSSIIFNNMNRAVITYVKGTAKEKDERLDLVDYYQTKGLSQAQSAHYEIESTKPAPARLTPENRLPAGGRVSDYGE